MGRRAHGRASWSFRVALCPYPVTLISRRLAPRVCEILAQLNSSLVVNEDKREIERGLRICLRRVGFGRPTCSHHVRNDQAVIEKALPTYRYRSSKHPHVVQTQDKACAQVATEGQSR